MNILQTLTRCNPNKANDMLAKYPQGGRGRVSSQRRNYERRSSATSGQTKEGSVIAPLFCFNRQRLLPVSCPVRVVDNRMCVIDLADRTVSQLTRLRHILRMLKIAVRRRQQLICLAEPIMGAQARTLASRMVLF